MRRIDFEYNNSRNTFGRQLFAIGILCVSVVLFEYVTLSDEANDWNAVAEKTSSKRLGAQSIGERGIARFQEMEDARSVILRLSVPWAGLFRAIESSSLENIALLSIQPDVQQRSIALMGEARTYGDVLTYMHRLERSGSFINVRILSHELRREDPQQPVAFNLSAQWRIEP